MIIRNLIYILQLELYDIKKFLKFSYTHLLWWKLEKRGRLAWTPKTIILYALTVIWVLLILALNYFLFGFFGLVSVLPVIIFLPILIAVALIILKPLDIFLKNRLINQAKNVLKKNQGELFVIGITGSYGKTSTREILTAILSEKFKVIKLEENINTDLGIADFIIKNIEKIKKNDIFIVEMGAYKRGDIKNICNLVDPDYSILTGINESHLERFGDMENIIKAKFELPESTKKLSVLNFDDNNIKNNYQRFKIKEIAEVSKENVSDIKILDNFQGLEFNIGETIFRTKLLATHNISLILLSVEIAKRLGMSLDGITKGVEKIDYVTHRLEPIYNEETSVWVVDDSYNGNFNGIISGMEVLGRARGRKIVLTPGLVELGEKSKEIHQKIGRLYAEKKIDLVLLIKTKAADHIIDGMEGMGFKSYKIYNSTKEAHNDLPNVIKSGDTIIFQNDLPDNYF